MVHDDKTVAKETASDGSEKLHVERAAYQNLARRVSSAAYMDAHQDLTTSERTENAKKKLRTLLQASPIQNAFGEGLTSNEADAHISKLVERGHAIATGEYNSDGKKGPDDNIDLATRLEIFHRTYDSQFHDAIEALSHIKPELIKTENGAYWDIDPKQDIRILENYA